jgi:hypothetical protein
MVVSAQQTVDDLTHLSRAAFKLFGADSFPRDARPLGSLPSRQERFRALMLYLVGDLKNIADRQRIVQQTVLGYESLFMTYPAGKSGVNVWLPPVVTSYIETGR